MGRHLACAVSAVFLSAQMAGATPDAWSSVTDRLLWAAEDRFVTLRVTELGYASYYQRQARVERVEISIWDGRILSRCSLGVQDGVDETTLGDWAITETPPDPGCDAAPSAGMVPPLPILQPDFGPSLEDGAIVLERRSDGRRSTLADAGFVADRLAAMTEAERQACLDQPQVWPTFGGCFLGQQPEDCTLSRQVWASANTVFFQVTCADADESVLWIALGRENWEAQTE